MALPKVIADTHTLILLPGSYEDFASIGLQGEMHFAALIALGSPDAARLLGWLTITAAGVILLGLGRQVGLKRRGQWIALAMLFTSSAVTWLIGLGKTDLFAAAFGLGAFYWAVRLRHDQNHIALWLLGLFSGFAILAKITYLPVMLPGVAFLVGWSLLDRGLAHIDRKDPPIKRLIGFLPLLAGFFIAVLPHLVKNAILFQNPVAPFGADSPDWLDQSWYEAEVVGRILLSYPLAITYGGYWGQLGRTSPLLLAFLPLALFLPRPDSPRSSPLIALTLAAVSGLLVWILLRPGVLAPRYMFANLLLLILPASRGAEFVSLVERKPALISFGILASIGITIITIGLGFNQIVFHPLKSIQYLSGQLPECGRDNRFCAVLSGFDENTPPGTRVFINSNQRYWLRPDLIQCSLTAAEIDEYLGLESDELRWEFIFEHGFRYLVDFEKPGFVIQSIPVPEGEAAPPWLSVLREGFSKNIVLRLESKDPDRSADLYCRQANSRVWTLAPQHSIPPDN